MEGKVLVRNKILWQISLAHPALAFSGLLSDSISDPARLTGLLSSSLSGSLWLSLYIALTGPLFVFLWL